MITFRKLDPGDFPLLGRWLAEPHVARWWTHETSPEAVERDFGPSYRGEEPNEDLLALLDGRPLGLLQRSRLADYPKELAEFAAIVPVPDGTMTIDYLIGDRERTGRGFGPAMIRSAVERTWAEHRGVSTILVAVVAANAPSWRALEKAGFTRVGEGNMAPDNPVDDPLHYVYRFDADTRS